MTALLAAVVVSLLAAGSAALIAAFFLWHPVPALVKRRVDMLLRGAAPRRANRVEALAPSAAMKLLAGFFTLGMPRQWGVSTAAMTLLLLGLVAGSLVWPLVHQVVGLPWAATLLLAVAAFWAAPNILARMEQARADKRFVELFPDAIDMIVRMLRASLPVSRAIRTVAEEAPSPINGVFLSLADQIDIGISFDDALGIGAKRIGLPDFRFFASAVALQHSTGGNLVSTLEILGDIVRRRRAVRLKARAATAEVRMSSYVLSSLPFLVIGALVIVNPAYLTPLIADPRGNIILLLAGAMLLAAFLSMHYMMRSVVRV